MKKERQKNLIIAGCFLAAFVLWTIVICYVDIQPTGPGGSTVGLATFNAFVHRLTGVHMELYILTDRLSSVPLLIAAGFGLLGLTQWVRQGHLLRVDRSILVLGGFYAAVAVLFLFFDRYIINYRPVLINGILEASYPSSTTLLVLSVMPTALLQFRSRISHPLPRKCASVLIIGFTAFMVIGRLVSGVHWVSDIIGGSLLSTALVRFYRAASGLS